MNFPLSIVIICKDAAATIGQALKSVEGLSDDVVVYDNGSTDDTIKIVNSFHTQLFQGPWLGFGPTRQKATKLAQHKWVLMVDADEVLTDGLRQELQNLQTPPTRCAYEFQVQHCIGSKSLHWGQWHRDYRVRLYHKDVWHWTNKLVHERLVASPDVEVIRFQNPMLHYPAVSIKAFEMKMRRYALLSAVQYQREGKRSTWIKRSISPVFSFVQNYVLKLGFLDGKTGYKLARIFSRYTAEKYKRLARRK